MLFGGLHILKKFQLNLGNGVPHCNCNNHNIESLICSTGFIFQAEILLIFPSINLFKVFLGPFSCPCLAFDKKQQEKILYGLILNKICMNACRSSKSSVYQEL